VGGVGTGFTVTVVLAKLLEEQKPEFATVSEYVVVTSGDAVGVQLFGSLRPVVGIHEQLVPPVPVSPMD
jgi:hypothetical protein